LSVSAAIAILLKKQSISENYSRFRVAYKRRARGKSIFSSTYYEKPPEGEMPLFRELFRPKDGNFSAGRKKKNPPGGKIPARRIGKTPNY